MKEPTSPRKWIRHPMTFSIALTITILLSKYPFSGAEDIDNARLNLSVEQKTDFWGSFSPWFFNLYSRDGWEVFYSCFFSFLITFTFVVVMARLPKSSRKLVHLLPLLTIQYLIISFAVSPSRDSALLSFIAFSVGAWLLAAQSRKRHFWTFLSIGSMIIGATFRPWLSLSLPFLLLSLNQISPIFKSFRKGAVLFSVFIVAFFPFVIEETFHETLHLTHSFPQQQVMIMDLASMACLSADLAQTKNALLSLQGIANSEPLTKEILCSQFYPQNWASVVFYGATNGSNSALRMIKPGDESTYIQLQDSWLTTILNQFPAYIQTKLMIGSQFLLAGESPSFSHGSIQGLITLPFELTKALRIFSALPVLLLLVVMTFSKRRFLWDSRAIAIISGFYLTFLGISMIAFIGDNQRYILPGAIIVYFLLFLRNTWSDNVTL